MKVVTVGTGAPRNFIRCGRICTATLVCVGNDKLLFDCGPGTTVNLLKGEINTWDINHLFFTHHHYDHDADFPVFVWTRWDLTPEIPPTLKIYGPKGTERMNTLMFGPEGVYGTEIEGRVNWSGHLWAYGDIGGKLPRKRLEVEAKDLTPEFSFEGNGWTITTALGVHGQPWQDSLAYRVDSPEGSVVITGDTTYSPPIVTMAKGADALVCWDIRTDAEEIATAAGIKKLILSHRGYATDDPRTLERNDQVRRGFSGEVVFAEELMEIPI